MKFIKKCLSVSCLLVTAFVIIFPTVSRHPKFRVRETTCNNCFPHDFKYLINNENICRTTFSDGAIELLIIIFSEHRNFEARQAVRDTWLIYTKNNTANVRYVFLLGKTGNASDHDNILQENKVHKDIVKEDFFDSYRNLTYKTIMGFKWTVSYCANAKFVLKTDDDVFLNIPNLLRLLKESGEEMDEKVIGRCSQKERPIREAKSKWYMSKQLYAEGRYPGFCSGTGYVIGMEMVKKIYKISPSVPFLHLEDVYVGLCLRKVGGFVKAVEGFRENVPDLDPCIYKGSRLITVHNMTPEMLRTIWTSYCDKPKNTVKPLSFEWVSWFVMFTLYKLSCATILHSDKPGAVLS